MCLGYDSLHRRQAVDRTTACNAHIKLHPELTLDEARAAAHALMGLIGSAARDNADYRIDPARHRSILHELAINSLGAF